MTATTHSTDRRGRDRRLVTSSALAVAATVGIALAAGTANPWRLVILDQIGEARLYLGWSLTAAVVVLGWLHLPRGGVRAAFVALAVLLACWWTVASFTVPPSIPPYREGSISSPDGTTAAGVSDRGGAFPDYGVYIETDRGLLSRRVYVPGPLWPPAPDGTGYRAGDTLLGVREPTVSYRSPDVIVASAGCRSVRIEFDPETLQVRRTSRNGADAADSGCGG